jgi:hypothetical protein
MRPQSINQFEFSIQTPGPYFEEIVLATAATDLNIREGHSYVVRLNDDPKHRKSSTY